MIKGLIRLSILSIESQFFKDRSYFIKIKSLNAEYALPAVKANQQFPRFISPSQNVELILYENQQTDTRFGYFNLPMSNLYKQQKKNHKIKVECVWKQKQDNSITQEISATVMLSIIYLDNAVSRLQVFIDEANLTRDTQAYGKMDPFVQLNFGDQVYTTSIKQQGGSHPIWKQNFILNLDVLYEQLKFIIKDKDMVSDDIIGTVTINPYQRGIFTNKCSQQLNQEVEINYEGIVAGKLKLGYTYKVIDN